MLLLQFNFLSAFTMLDYDSIIFQALLLSFCVEKIVKLEKITLPFACGIFTLSQRVSLFVKIRGL